MEGFCRGCLIKYDVPEELLEYTEKNRRLFIYATGLQVKRNDTFTFQLCRDCYLNMKQSCRFKKLCRTSDKKFKTYLSLKDAGDTSDFCTYLKNNEDNFQFRFPHWGGNSTPANQKKDDDNESTCTSIGNYIRDILKDTEMPDTEARIVRQVIEEEADVLDESLDSHWMQDDVSIATDFRLDFSFSPFSTPHSVSNDHCYTPKRITDQPTDPPHYSLLNTIIEKTEEGNIKQEEEKEKILDDILTDSLLDSSFGEQNFNAKSEIYQGQDIENVVVTEVPSFTDDQINQVNSKNYYVDNTFIEHTMTNDGFNVNTDIGNLIPQCAIDRRLEEALKNNNNKDFSLEDLLASPTVYPNAAAPSTPMINNILFGETLDENSNQANLGQTIENFENVQGDIYNLDDFFNVSVKIEKESPPDPQGNPPDIISEKKGEEIIKDNKSIIESKKVNCVCSICGRVFKGMRHLKIHSKKKHKIKMPMTKRKMEALKIRICHHCGREMTDKRNFIRHLKTHQPKDRKCGYCGLTFTSEAKLNLHNKIHFSCGTLDKSEAKKECCRVCGKLILNSSMFRHLRVHKRDYVATCDQCGKGYYTHADLRDHMLVHTGERPHKCEFCANTFKRKSALTRHMRLHTGELRFRCDNCNNRYANKSSLIKHITSATCKDFKLTGKMIKPSKKPREKKIKVLSEAELAMKPFECKYCHKRRKSKNLLILHQRTSKPCLEMQLASKIEISYEKGGNEKLLQLYTGSAKETEYPTES